MQIKTGHPPIPQTSMAGNASARGTLSIKRGNQLKLAHTDGYVAMRDAFNAAVRRLEDFVRRQEGRVKRHAVEPSREAAD